MTTSLYGATLKKVSIHYREGRLAMLKFIIWGAIAFGLSFSDSFVYQNAPNVFWAFTGTAVLGSLESLRWHVVHQVRSGEQWTNLTWERNAKTFILTVLPAFIAGSFVGYWASTGVWYHP